MGKSTIFITSFHSIISRNILSTSLLDILSENYRLVIFVPDFKKKYFVNRFSNENILIEGVSSIIPRRDRFFSRLALFLSYSNTLRIKKRSDLGGFLRFSDIFAKTASKSKFLIKFMQFLDGNLFFRERFSEYFKIYKPSLIFATDVQNEFDVRFMQEANKFSVKTIGMIRSWDNPSSKGLLRFIPDRFIVHNNLIKEELKNFNFLENIPIEIIGIPHYDSYLAKDFISRDSFFSNYSLDARKKTVLFAPTGDRYINNNNVDRQIIELLGGLDINILVRMPPTDTANLEGLHIAKATLAIQHTGIRSWKDKVGEVGSKVNEISSEDDESLRNSLHFADVIISGPSTICVDAAFFDKPVILISFDGLENRPYYSSIRRYFDYDHWQPILRADGASLIRKKDDLIPVIQEYLDNPGLKSEGRRRIVTEQCLYKDGNSTSRLAKVILSNV